MPRRNDETITQDTDKDERRQRAMRALERLKDADLWIVPQTPSQYMCAVGAQAGGVDLFTARRIYRAMLAAAHKPPPTTH